MNFVGSSFTRNFVVVCDAHRERHVFDVVGEAPPEMDDVVVQVVEGGEQLAVVLIYLELAHRVGECLLTSSLEARRQLFDLGKGRAPTQQMVSIGHGQSWTEAGARDDAS